MTLTDGEIAGLRDTIETETLAGTAVVSRYMSVSDGQGGQTNSYSAFGTVSGHVSPLSGSEAEIASRIAENSRWVITLPASCDVDEKDQVEIGGETFEVDTVRAPRTWQLATRVYAHRTD